MSSREAPPDGEAKPEAASAAPTAEPAADAADGTAAAPEAAKPSFMASMTGLFGGNKTEPDTAAADAPAAEAQGEKKPGFFEGISGMFNVKPTPPLAEADAAATSSSDDPTALNTTPEGPAAPVKENSGGILGGLFSGPKPATSASNPAPEDLVRA